MRDKFATFKNDDLKDYVKFNGVLNEFAHYYSLEEYSLKDLDRYLWQLGKEYSKINDKNYKFQFIEY